MTHRLVDVAIRIGFKQPPYGLFAFKGDAALFARGVEKKRQNGVLANVIGDVLFGIVRAHLFLVDVLFENVPKDIGD